MPLCARHCQRLHEVRVSCTHQSYNASLLALSDLCHPFRDGVVNVRAKQQAQGFLAPFV
eukprot:CAMPEP_0172727634 /NCGR_PEP_ID=MMETSP1074-20121228/91792_1 /TAXON_ID=2916 /ORGANISM="Ceratium fusus, Strain PA161109" /LENGTH=58 /DNA_ID=CAMNT_0013554807 /DNA_START=224 /DNA_END=400 /DNA_ORIENTATION=-